MIGELLGHWRIVAKIGEGGMGVVYRAHDEVLRRDVALKIVSSSGGLDASASHDLLKEARSSSSLAHPNICTASLDEGRSWNKILEGLPSVLCVRHVSVHNGSSGSSPVPASRPSRSSSRAKSSAARTSRRRRA